MAIRSKLIEHVARRIAEALKSEWPAVRFRVNLTKERPPVNGDVAAAAYETET
jgi:dihydroneopterin aldolase